MKCELEQWRVGSSPVLNIAVWELSETCQAVGPTLKERPEILKSPSVCLIHFLSSHSFEGPCDQLDPAYAQLTARFSCCGALYIFRASSLLKQGLLCALRVALTLEWNFKGVVKKWVGRAARAWRCWSLLGQRVGQWPSQAIFSSIASSEEWQGAGWGGPKPDGVSAASSKLFSCSDRDELLTWAWHTRHALEGSLWLDAWEWPLRLQEPPDGHQWSWWPKES